MSRDMQGPQVWSVVYRTDEGFTEVGNLYESKEAALLEIKWLKERRHMKPHRYHVERHYVHTLDLSRRRWLGVEDG